MGVRGWSAICVLDRSWSPIKRCPLKIVRPVSGKAGQAIVKSVSKVSISELITGPIFPSSVESNVEQYLKKNCLAPVIRSQSSVAVDWATASVAGMVRDFNATTTASTSGIGLLGLGTPSSCTVLRPPRTNVFARSVAPVKSSAMHPRIGVMVDLPELVKVALCRSCDGRILCRCNSTPFQ